MPRALSFISVAKSDKDTKSSRKNVQRLERPPTSSEALALKRNGASHLINSLKFPASLCKWYPRSVM